MMVRTGIYLGKSHPCSEPSQLVQLKWNYSHYVKLQACNKFLVIGNDKVNQFNNVKFKITIIRKKRTFTQYIINQPQISLCFNTVNQPIVASDLFWRPSIVEK